METDFSICPVTVNKRETIEKLLFCIFPH